MKILVIGAGQMGAGIAQVCAQAGHDVLLNDIDDARIRRGIDGIAKLLDRSVEKGRLTVDERAAVLARIAPLASLSQTVAGVEIAIEAATENVSVKLELFLALDRVVP